MVQNFNGTNIYMYKNIFVSLKYPPKIFSGLKLNLTYITPRTEDLVTLELNSYPGSRNPEKST